VLRVASFPRSGTHYLCALLKENFYPDGDLSLAVYSWEVGHWSRRILRTGEQAKVLPYGKLFYSHQFPRYWESSEEIVYIWREGGGVAWSLYRWERAWHKDKPKLSLREFLRQPLDWYGTLRVPAPGSGNEYRIFDQWLIIRGACLVSYEKLVLNPAEELEKIAEHFGLKKPNKWVIDIGMVGYSPSSKPNPDAWRDHFSPEDIRLYFGYRRRLEECLALSGL
jgi:hypothetical protein